MAETKDIQKPEKEMSPEKANLAMTSAGFEPTTMLEAWRFGEALSQSEMVPERFRGNPGDCVIVLDLAKRLKSSWLAVMQHVYSVHGSIGMEAVMVVALVNQSGLFVDPLEYEVEGTDAKKPDFRVRAFAKRKSTGTVLYGPWIDWELVKGEGWLQKKGSKWQTMADQMFHFRAASWFQRRHCPEVTMGMLTTDDLADMPRKHVESQTFDEAQKEATEKIKKEAGSDVVETDPKAKGDTDFMNDEDLKAFKAEADRASTDRKKKKLAAAEKKAKAAADAKKQANDKDALPKYHCDGCGKDFEIPCAFNPKKGNQCGTCFSWNTHENVEE